MKLLKRRVFPLILLIIAVPVFSQSVTGFLKIAAIRIQFQVDEDAGTTGNGLFLLDDNSSECGVYTIDPPPHDRDYFISQLKAVDSYYRNVSYNQFGIDLSNSTIFPDEQNTAYTVPNSMSWYNPYGESDEVHEERITQLFRDALSAAESVSFDDYDLIVIFHAGIGQDFSLPTLDPTPEDIPSTYIDRDMLGTPHLGVEHGIILPETQNHLLFPETESIFSSTSEPCSYQFGLTGTFALMVGFAAGMPPLWDINTGESGLGIFGLMDQGSNNGQGVVPAPPDAWTRVWAGWVIPETVNPPSTVELPSINVENDLNQIQITDDEYFLIENRNNWFRERVSVDSARYTIWKSTGTYPGFYKVLFDSVSIEKDDNGVITSIPNYDLGLPASGLLIWHIDETAIESAPDWYSLNADITKRGVDLEEADGAQDIGYPSIHMFADPSSGYFGDMWFKGNQEYINANGVTHPVFGPYTHPNTKANSGASTFLKIDNISLPDDTMTFTVSNTILAEGFPDSTANIVFVCDVDGDGNRDILGGRDSLWWASINNVSNRRYFKKDDEVFTYSDEIFITKTNFEDSPLNLIVSTNPYVYEFQYDQEMNDIVMISSGHYSESLFVVKNGIQFDTLTVVEYEEYKKSVTIDYESGLLKTQKDESYFYPLEGDTISLSDVIGISGEQFLSIQATDLNLDGSPEILMVNADHNLFAYDINLIMMPGFPVSLQLNRSVFIYDLVGDSHSEIVVKSLVGDKIYVLNHTGDIIYQFASSVSDRIQYVGALDESAYIVTSFNIWKFDQTENDQLRSWSYADADPMHSRTIQLPGLTVDSELELFDKDRTYAYPNPVYEDEVTLRVQCGAAESIEIKIYDLAGYYVETIIIDDPIQYMPNEVHWDVRNVEPGVYFANVAVTEGDETQSKVIKIAVIK